MKKLYSLLVMLLFGIIVLTIQSCNKDDDKQAELDGSEEIKEGQISGTVILPPGSNVNVNSLLVASPLDQQAVNNSAFTVNGYVNTFTTQLLLSSTNEIILMGYSYPNQPNNNISSESSALALVMNSMAALSLSNEGKINTINKILIDPNFNKVVQEIDKSAMIGRPLTDTTNIQLSQSLIGLFQSVSKRSTAAVLDPVVVHRAERNLRFHNNGRAHSSVIGIYKDNVKVKNLVVDGLQMAPTSLFEALNGYGGTSADPVDYDYAMQGNGTFKVKIRTGLPGSNDGTPEYNEAFRKNLSDIALTIMLAYSPNLDKMGCAINVFNTVLGIVQNTIDIASPAKKNTMGFIYTIVSTVFSSVDDIVENCEKHFNKNFFSRITKVFKLIDKTFTLVGNGANITFFGVHWAQANSAIDTCFTAQGNTVQSTCCTDPQVFALLTGGSSKTWRLVSSNGTTHSPYCGQYETETFTTTNQYTRSFGQGSSTPPCDPPFVTTNGYQLCGMKIGYGNVGGNINYSVTIKSITSTSLVTEWKTGTNTSNRVYVPH